MNSFNVKQASDEALRLLEQSGASAKTIKEYRTTGFGAFVRHFAKQDSLDVTPEMLDAFVLEERKRFENGEFSNWRWLLIRRGGELLKQYARFGNIDVSMLRPWEPVLRKPRQSVEKDIPTPEQLADPDDLFALIWRVKQELHKMDLVQATVRHYSEEGLTVILRRHTSSGLQQYSESLVEELISETRKRLENGQASRSSYQSLRKASFLLSEMHKTGKISLHRIPNWGQREPIPVFAELLRHFCCNAEHTGILAEGSIRGAKSAIRVFLFELEDRGFKSFDGATLADISGVETHIAKRYTSGLHSAVFCVRVFLRHLYENNFTSGNLSLAIPEMVARRTVFREGFTREETERLLETPDMETSTGKRNYAMMLLAAQTGLRACDVVNLKRGDIDWRRKEIRIVQRKTGKPLSLPLEPESGNAIADYLLSARPKSDLPYIFLCHTGVKRPINNRSASAIVTRYLKLGEIESDIPRRGFHSFRRSFGTRLLQNEIPLELLRQLLGHSKIDSAKPYLSVDEKGLKDCALGLVPIGTAGDSL